MSVEVLSPYDCTDKQLKQFESLVLEGGQVQHTGLRTRIQQCKFLAFYYATNGHLVAIAAIKKPSQQYIQKIKSLAQPEEPWQEPTYELGYSYTQKSMQGKGINKALLHALMKQMHYTQEKIFATTGHEGMKKNLRAAGFFHRGTSFSGKYTPIIEYFEK